MSAINFEALGWGWRISEQRSMIEPRVERHAGKCLGKRFCCDLDKPVPFVETVRSNELLGSTQIHVPDLGACCRQHQPLKETSGDTVLFATMRRFHEHLTQ